MAPVRFVEVKKLAHVSELSFKQHFFRGFQRLRVFSLQRDSFELLLELGFQEISVLHICLSNFVWLLRICFFQLGKDLEARSRFGASGEECFGLDVKWPSTAD